ncbi:MAG: hypothetical protein P1V97_01755 [Planctomycetota bacterium]|nr:hypothetical protein [Planctomycetota bacterium]
MNKPTSSCVRHTDRNAQSNCERCGDFTCEERLERLFNKDVCQGCVERYAIDTVDKFKAGLWGKRDVFVWIYGLGGSLVSTYCALSTLIVGLDMAASGGPTIAIYLTMAIILAILGVSFVTSMAYLFLQRWARWASFL